MSGERDEGSSRILALSDGVFAVATTLLVLFLAVPHVQHGLLENLGKQWPQFLSYGVSFLIIGIIWANHHHMFTHIKQSNHTFMIINIVFLMWVAFLPFPAAVLGQYLGNPVERKTAMALYAGAFFVGVVLFNLVWRYGTHQQRLTGEHPDMEAIRKTDRSYILGPIAYLIDFGLAFISPEASLALFFVLAAVYAVTPYPGGHTVAPK